MGWIRNRACEDTYVFDGCSIATHYFKYKWVDVSDPAEEFVKSTEVVHFSSHDLLHEVMHFVAAAPEFGLGYVYLNGGSLIEAPCVVDPDEALRQEILTQLLCIRWGTGKISPKLAQTKKNWPGNLSWEKYQAVKEAEQRGEKYSFASLSDDADRLIRAWRLL